jgi:hypothetical protein
MHGGFNHGPIKLLDVPENTTTAPPVLVARSRVIPRPFLKTPLETRTTAAAVVCCVVVWLCGFGVAEFRLLCGWRYVKTVRASLNPQQAQTTALNAGLPFDEKQS